MICIIIINNKLTLLIFLFHVGSITGLSEGASRGGNVHIVQLHTPTEILLSCRCSIYQPLWQVYHMGSHSISNSFNGNVSCTNFTNGGKKCDRDIAFLHEHTADIELRTDNLFVINQSTIIMCYSSLVREIVVFDVSSGACMIIAEWYDYIFFYLTMKCT